MLRDRYECVFEDPQSAYTFAQDGFATQLGVTQECERTDRDSRREFAGPKAQPLDPFRR